ncbi:MAG: hypothetical protein E6K80_05195 [Candidatus Eisenbacteria bacterium]|uniref:Uncharacterized protein n=1 Tax=Eiseniibacteriota bacterium TaxID=2212470 RepID=A0A538U6Q2_UNCEI|nr:MAG: hypothetical protein E6K80_05195 [Candidatus Eisenbacteria bacterium]
MAGRKESRRVAQAWIELAAIDLEAASALEVAHDQLAAGRRLQRLRRMRLIELEGRLPARERLESMLHGSTQFYNPHKERCIVRLSAGEPAPVASGEHAVLVVERAGDRRAAAERWWRHETGETVIVREGTAWLLTFENGAGEAELEDLALVRERRRGLLCNPHSQECRWAKDAIPLPWLGSETPASDSRPARRTSSPTRSKR